MLSLFPASLSPQTFQLIIFRLIIGLKPCHDTKDGIWMDSSWNHSSLHAKLSNSLTPLTLLPVSFMKEVNVPLCSLQLDSIAENNSETSYSKPSYETPKNFSNPYIHLLTHSKHSNWHAWRIEEFKEGTSRVI
jgi:hypothetical protein